MSERISFAGLSMLEIIIAMMLLALVVVGLVNVFVVGRNYMAHSGYRIVASQLATSFFEPLQNEVNESTWDTSTNLLNVTTPARTGSAVPKDGVWYIPNYTITNESVGTFLRRVRVNITWNETKF